MDTSIIEKVKRHVEATFREKVPSEYKYHDLEHTRRVVNSVQELSENAELDEEQKEVAILAAYFHDLGFSIDPDNHEYHSKILAGEFLSSENYPSEKIRKVVHAIEATKMNWSGQDKFCGMIRDADLSGLAAPDYDKLNEKLRQELSFRDNAEISREEWIEKNIEFLKNHDYITDEAKELYAKGKKKNLKKLKKKSKKIKNKKSAISNSKSAQTQFKTALRNHIDLSAMADNKANIMLSVNAVIITVGLPLLIDKATLNPELYIPTIILAIVCLVSMIFATLSTRPIQMKGVTDSDQIHEKKSNLFFFGNYYKMKVEDYERAIKEVSVDEEILDSSIIRDLFFLGKSLGRKFDYLRWCYNFFMYGIAAAVLSYLVMIAI